MNLEQVIHDYRQWKLARLAFKKSLQRSGEKGPVVRRCLRALRASKFKVRCSIAAARNAKRVALIACVEPEVSGVAS